MKKLILLLITGLFAAGLSAQTVDSQSQKLIETYVKSNVDIKMEMVNQSDLGKVFVGKFYKILVGFIESGSGSNSCGDADFVNILGTTVTMAEKVHTDIECPVLLSLLRKDFMMKDENAAKLFEACLNILYPVSKSESSNLRHFKKDQQWIFLRGKFFDDYTAFIVTTAPNGTITKIEVKLSYPVNP